VQLRLNLNPPLAETLAILIAFVIRVFFYHAFFIGIYEVAESF
jgi:hypothetical protein